MKQHTLGRDKDPRLPGDIGASSLKLRKAGWSLLTLPGLRAMGRLVFPPTTIRYGEAEGSVAFTIDDGFCGLDNPGGCMLEEVRALFEEFDARATFFVTGTHCEHTSDADITRLLADGHELANHSMRDHPYTDATPEEFAADLEETAAILARHQAQPSPWYRAPFGRLNRRMQAVLDAKGLTHVVCDAFANDTAIPDAEWVAGFVLRHTRPGSILLIHMPERRRREWALEAMRLTLEGLAERGLEVTTLSALLEG
jgi:peptidoglycan/xylan/chitin deacetylase (PgdA/CDA1 family)